MQQLLRSVVIVLAVIRRPYPPLPLPEALDLLLPRAGELRHAAQQDNLLDKSGNLITNFPYQWLLLPTALDLLLPQAGELRHAALQDKLLDTSGNLITNFPYQRLLLPPALDLLLPGAGELRHAAQQDNLLKAADRMVIDFQFQLLRPFFERHVSVLHPQYGFRLVPHPEHGLQRVELFPAADLYNHAYMEFRKKLWKDPDSYNHLLYVDQLGAYTHGFTKTLAVHLRSKALQDLRRMVEHQPMESLPVEKSHKPVPLPEEASDNQVLRTVSQDCSPRELEVASLLAQEVDRNDIADRLGIPRNYVDKLVERIRHRLEVHVAELLVQGLTFNEIPDRLGITRNYVIELVELIRSRLVQIAGLLAHGVDRNDIPDRLGIQRSYFDKLIELRGRLL